MLLHLSKLHPDDPNSNNLIKQSLGVRSEQTILRRDQTSVSSFYIFGPIFYQNNVEKYLYPNLDLDLDADLDPDLDLDLYQIRIRIFLIWLIRSKTEKNRVYLTRINGVNWIITDKN